MAQKIEIKDSGKGEWLVILNGKLLATFKSNSINTDVLLMRAANAVVSSRGEHGHTKSK